MNLKNTKNLAICGLLAALVLLATFVIKLPVPITNGYVHLGDGFIFLAALLTGPVGALVAGVGSMLADLIGGYFPYILPTFVIKAAMGFIAGSFAVCDSKNLLRNLIVFLCAEAVMVLGYFLFEGVLYGFAAALGAVFPNIIQGVFGVVVGLALTPVAEQLKKYVA